MAEILIYALNYAPEPIGVGRYTADIGAYLAEHGHSVRVVTALPHYPEWKVAPGYRPFSYVRESRPGERIWRCPLLLKRPMRGVWRMLAPLSFAVTSLPLLAWTMFRHRPSIVFCVEPTVFAAPAALAFAWLTGSRTILHVQDLEIDAAFAVGHLKGGLSQRMAVACEDFLLRRFDHIITVSNRMRDRIAEKGVASNAIVLVRNWVDLKAIKPMQGRNRYRDEFGWSDALTIVLYAGSVGAKQGLEVVLDAARVLESRSDVLFVVAGAGPAKDGLVADYGNLNNVVFIPPQPEARMNDLLNLADLHVLPQSRGIADLVLPSKLGGMLASGKPVLVTADRGTELHDVLDGIALVVPAGDSAAIVREIEAFTQRGGRDKGGSRTRDLAATMSRDHCLRDILVQVIGPG